MVTTQKTETLHLQLKTNFLLGLKKELKMDSLGITYQGTHIPYNEITRIRYWSIDNGATKGGNGFCIYIEGTKKIKIAINTNAFFKKHLEEAFGHYERIVNLLQLYCPGKLENKITHFLWGTKAMN